MSNPHTGAGGIATHGIAAWLCRAASPTFALMALLNCLLGGDSAMPCMGANASPFIDQSLTGMPAMYLLMSAFHLAPWLRMISGRQDRE